MKCAGEMIEELLMKLENSLADHYYYHSLEHTALVVSESRILADAEGLSGREKDLLLIAAAGHDLGYLVSSFDHEKNSARITGEYLSGEGMDERELEVVRELILATALPTSPRTLAEKIICDADLSSAGRSDFPVWAGRLRRELAAVNGKIFTDREWVENELKFVSGVEYYTASGRARYGVVKEKNIHWLRGLLS